MDDETRDAGWSAAFEMSEANKDMHALATAQDLAARYKEQADRAATWKGSPSVRDDMVKVNTINWRAQVKRANEIRAKHDLPPIHYGNGNGRG